MTTFILSTKLYIPPPRPNLVERSRLIERLDEGLGHKLTLISAPAGFGKTTLLSEWIHRRGGITPPVTAPVTAPVPAPLHIAWLSLDEGDNEPVRFWTYLIAALQQVDAGIGVDIRAALESSLTLPVETLLATLTTEIAATEQELVLILDDYHVIINQEIHNALDSLLDYLPPNAHLVVAGRVDPPISLSRLRVRGEMTEIRPNDLRFTKEEAAAFLNDLMGLELSSADVAALEARTEGWIASLHLAALSLQGRPDKHDFVAAFSGSYRYVIDYLVDEVMSHQSDEIRAFLRQTSILDRFCAPLCDAALEISSSRSMLQQLETANLFLVPLDDERCWYRYHHLFADFLGQRLHEHEPERIADLHRRASRWYEAQGWIDQAVRHALVAEDDERAACLVEQTGMAMIVQKRFDKLLHWIARLPPHLLPDHPHLCVWHAWALLFTGRVQDVEPILQIAEANQHLAPQLPISGYVVTIRAFTTGPPQALDLAQHAIEQMTNAPHQAGQAASHASTLFHRGVVTIVLADNSKFQGDLIEAREFYTQAIRLNQQAGNIYAVLGAIWNLGSLAVIRGQLHRAEETYRQGFRIADGWSKRKGQGQAELLATDGLHLRLGALLYQWNDLAGATTHIQRAITLYELGGAWESVLGYRMLAYVEQANGNDKAAWRLLQKSSALLNDPLKRQLNPYIDSSLTQLQLILGRRNPDMAHLLTDVAARINDNDLLPNYADAIDFTDPTVYGHAFKYVHLARALIVFERAGEALSLLERLLKAAWSMGRQGDVIEILALQALAFHSTGQTPAALAALGQALALAEPEGYVRVFVDEGKAMAELMAAIGDQQPAARSGYVIKLLAAFEPTGGLVEPLSERELEVLRLMAPGLKYKEMAERLFVSVNTIRYHVKNIYGKLGVQSRTLALTRARELGLF